MLFALMYAKVDWRTPRRWNLVVEAIIILVRFKAKGIKRSLCQL